MPPPEPDVQGGDLLFVIPCRNEEAHIAQVIKTLLADPGAPKALIVVADGESTDASCDIVRALQAQEPRVVLMANPGRLQSIGLNLAARRFGEGRTYMVRVDAHADYPPTYGSELVKAAKAVGADSVVVSMDAQGRTCFQSACAAAQNSPLSNGGAAHRMGVTSRWVDHGHHALMRLEAFEAVGGYNETFATNEDAELDLRLNRAGYRVWLTADQRIVYYPRSTARALYRQYFRFGVGRAQTFRLHHMRPKLRQLIPICLGPGLLVTALAPLTPLAWIPLVTWGALCIAYGAVLGVRAKNACQMAAGAPAMIMHLAWSLGYWSEQLRPGRPSKAFPPRP